MIKQTDALIIFIVLAAIVGFFVLASSSTSLVVVLGLAVAFGGLIGLRLHRARAARRADEEDNAEHAPADRQPEPVQTSAQTADEKAAAVAPKAAEPSSGLPAYKPDTGSIAKSAPAEDSPVPPDAILLKTMMSSISEGITYKDLDGRYVSANAAFGQMVERNPSDIVGQDDASVFGHLTAQTLLASDDAAVQRGRMSMTLELPLPAGSRYYEITKASISDDDDQVEGVVAVWRDVTDAARGRIRREKAMRETITAFTKSIELHDPYLSDHAQRLASLSTAVCDVMGLEDDIRTTVELAAYLSQIGKLGLDSQLLGEQRRFTEQEIKEMQKHVHHTARLLRDLDFGLPVAKTLFQTNERLDGSGYPQGLEGRDIIMPARILGACDVFCARVSPRSYRPAIEPEAALDILLQNPHRYDATVVRAMQQVVHLPRPKRASA